MQRKADPAVSQEDAIDVEMQGLFLGASGLLGAGYGLYMLWSPTALADSPGIVATNPIATAELRAVFGGIHTALGGLLLLAVFIASLVAPALVCVITVTGGTGAGRLAGALVASDFSAYTLGLTAFELVVAAIAFAFWTATSV